MTYVKCSDKIQGRVHYTKIRKGIHINIRRPQTIFEVKPKNVLTSIL